MNNISYAVENLYTDKGEYKSRLKLEQEPPTLLFTSDDEPILSLELQKDSVNELLLTLEEVQKAYCGMQKQKSNVISFLHKYPWLLFATGLFIGLIIRSL